MGGRILLKPLSLTGGERRAPVIFNVVDTPKLRLKVEEKRFETIVYCSGKLNDENAEEFLKEICSLVPRSRGHVAAITCRIQLDFSQIKDVDSAGLGALAKAEAAAKRGGCSLEVVNTNSQFEGVETLDPKVNKIVAVKPVTVVARFKNALKGKKAA